MQAQAGARAQSDINTLRNVLSSYETPQLRRLRAMARAEAGPDTSGGQWRSQARCSTPGGGSVLDGAVLEWRANEVVWMRGAKVHRVFRYPERVLAACCAWIEVPASGSGSRSARDASPAGDSVTREHALCVVLDKVLVFYIPKLGDEYLQPLFFRFAAIHPLRTGVLLVRASEPEDMAPRAGGVSPLPMALYLRNVFGDLTGWSCADAITRPVARPSAEDGAASSGGAAPGAPPSDLLHGALHRFLEVDEHVVYACDDPDTSAWPVLVTASTSARALRIYVYACAGASADQPALAARAASGRSSAGDPPMDAATPRPRKSARRSSSSAASLLAPNAPRRSSGLRAGSGGPADLHMVSRRLSEVSARESLAPGADGTAAAAAPPSDMALDPAGVRFASASSAASSTRRRKSSLPAAADMLDGSGTRSGSFADMLRHDPLAARGGAAPFGALTGAHACVALLEEIAVPELTSVAAARSVSCFTFGSQPLLYLVVPASRRAFARELHEVRAGDAQVCLETRVPLHRRTDPLLAARALRPVRVVDVERADALLLHGEDGAVRLVLGAPGPGVHSVPLPADAGEVFCRPACPLTAAVLDVLCATLPRPAASAVLARWFEARSAARPEEEWLTLERLLLGGAPPRAARSAWERLLRDERMENEAMDALVTDAGEQPKAEGARSAPPVFPPELTPLVAVALHLRAQEARLDLAWRRPHLPRLARTVVQLCARLGWGAWVDYWTRLLPDTARWARLSDGEKTAAADRIGAPPDVYSQLHAALRGEHVSYTQMAEPAVAAALAAAGEAAAEAAPASRALALLASACGTTTSLLEVFGTLGALAAGTLPGGVHGAQAIVQQMLCTRLDAAALHRLPVGVTLLLEEARRTCQLDPPRGWTPDAYGFVRRHDAALQASTEGGMGAGADAGGGGTPALACRVNAQLRKTLPGGVPLDPLSAQLFSHDYRLAEVARMLRTDAPATTNAPVLEDAEKEETERHAEALALSRALADRTLAACVGRGMFRMASRALRTTGTWSTPRVCAAVRTAHGVALPSAYAQEPQETEWPEFHNGAAAALEIAVHAHRALDSNWIFAHSGAREGDARHAGFLLGLGLNGHLAALGRVHAYRYLAPRHPLTTTGLVLGLAASFLGTGDAAARQVMAVQVAAFLPQGSVPLQLPALTQAAGLLGMGLVFCGTDHRWTAERLLAQIDVRRLETSDANDAHHDVYAQSAGLALGLVLLGRARRAPMDNAADAALLAQLRRLVAGTGAARDVVGASRAAGPAMLALALIFLRSNRRDAAALLAPPASAAALAHVRPDLLLPRTLARALIMWNAIAPSDAWLDATLPAFLRGVDPGTAPLEAQLAWYNMRAGACLALALKYAGTGDASARAVLLRQLRRCVRAAGSSYAERIAQAARDVLRDVLHLALATVMAGSGDVDLLRLLRVAHGSVGREAQYGSQMASHMALGLLFLGGGRFTLGTSDVAVAALLLALLPRFPSRPSDNRTHLQAARHFWVLALEPRLLAARDVASGELCFLPLAVRSRAEPPPGAERKEAGTASLGRTTTAIAPTLLPPFERLALVATASRRYWPAARTAASLTAPGEEQRQIHLLHVQRRTGYLSYLDDPHGHRSIFARSSFLAREHLDACAAADARGTLRDLQELVRSFETAPQYAALVHRVCRTRPGVLPTRFQTYATSVLMDCLTSDAPMLVRIHLGLWAGLERGLRAADAPLFLAELRLLDAFYGGAADRALRQSDGGAEPLREPLVSRELLASVLLRALAPLEAPPAAAQRDASAYLAGAPLGASDGRAARGAAYLLAALAAPPQAMLAALRAKYEPAAAEDPQRAVEALRRVLGTLVGGHEMARREVLLHALTGSWAGGAPASWAPGGCAGGAP